MMNCEKSPRKGRGERGQRQWREAGFRSESYYRRDRPGREGAPAICEHPAEAAETEDDQASRYSARQSTCQ